MKRERETPKEKKERLSKHFFKTENLEFGIFFFLRFSLPFGTFLEVTSRTCLKKKEFFVLFTTNKKKKQKKFLILKNFFFE